MMLKDGDVGKVSILYVERRSLEEKDTFHIKSRTRTSTRLHIKSFWQSSRIVVHYFEGVKIGLRSMSKKATEVKVKSCSIVVKWW